VAFKNWPPAAKATVVAAVIIGILGVLGPLIKDRLNRPRSTTWLTIHDDPQTYTSPDHLTLSDVKALSKHDPPHYKDSLMVSFSLTNESNVSITLGNTFVAWRAATETGQPGASHAGNIEKQLKPAEAVTAEATIPLDTRGKWEVWACYRINPDHFCPDSWQYFTFVVK
jgi:hypothetical protein